MFGKKKSNWKKPKIKSVKAVKKAEAKRYARTVKCAIENYSRLISTNTKNTSKHWANEMNSFIHAVKQTDDYKENKKKFDKIIAAAKKKSRK